jgi:NitT/TauT family transport system substrate-binding protein
VRRSLLVCVAVLLAACASSSSSTTVAPGARAFLNVAWTAVSGANSGLWTAYEAGYFRDEQLTVELTHIPSSSRVIPAIVAGEVQFSTLDGLTLVQAGVSGADVKSVLGVTNRLVFSVLASSKIQSPQDLKGKKLGITRIGSSTHTAALQALKLWGFEVKDVTLIQLSEVPAILAGLEAGQIDAGVVSPPTNVRAKKAGFKELVNLAVSGPDYPSVTIGTKGSYLTANPDVMQRFVRAYSRGVQRFKSDRKFGEQSINRYLQLDDKAVLADTYDEFSKYLADPPLIKGLETVISELGATDSRAVGARPEQFIDLTAVKALDSSGFYKKG